MSGLKNGTGRGRGVNQEGGRGEGRGKGGVKVKNNKEKEAGAEGKTEDPEGEGEPEGEDSRGDAGTESAGQLGQLGWGRPRTELRVTRREKRVRGDLSRRPAGRSRGGEGRTRWGRCPQGGNHHKAH